MPTRDEMFPSKWLKASDVPQPRIATIERCQVEMVGQGAKAEHKAVAYFRNNTFKPLVINATNWDQLVLLTGSGNSDGWDGTQVELFAVDVMGRNGMTRGIRLRRPQPRKKAKPAAGRARRRPRRSLPADDGEPPPF